MSKKLIQLRDVCVHNLKNIDLEIPHGQFLVICGPSGSGKSSLAIHTLYAEGQRRYVESFSPYARQFLEQVERPAAQQMLGIPPAVAFVARRTKFGRRATIASTIELTHHLQLLFTRIAKVVCPNCRVSVSKSNPQLACELLDKVSDGVRIQIGFQIDVQNDRHSLGQLKQTGFTRSVVGETSISLAESPASWGGPVEHFIIVDRLVAGRLDRQRLLDSLTQSFDFGRGSCFLWLSEKLPDDQLPHHPHSIDGQTWYRVRQDRVLTCPQCATRFPEAEPQRLSDASPLGACPSCEGLGSVSHYDLQKIIPDPSISIRDGAIAPWNSPSYTHEKDELMALAADFNIDIDLPFKDLPAESIKFIWQGVPERKFGGLDGFFRWLERRRYKMHLRVFTSRWRSFSECETCHGQRLNQAALVYRIKGQSIVDFLKLSIEKVDEFLVELGEDADVSLPGKLVLRRLRSQTQALVDLGLGYLELNRTMQSLSAGESQRVLIGQLLKSSLVNLLFVFDEPTSGLHFYDAAKVTNAIQKLCDRHNTIIVVEHSIDCIAAAERVIELGPGVGEQGGEIVFDGKPQQLKRKKDSLTSRVLNGDFCRIGAARRRKSKSSIKLLGCHGRNLQNIDVEFPLGVFCLVVGVSGSGKSSLIRDTLCAALGAGSGEKAASPLPFRKIVGEDRVASVILVDDTPLHRSTRSNPITFVKAYDLVRKLLADTEQARAKNFNASHFSLNVAGGRCDKCRGEGFLTVDMQFLADMRMICDECGGQRFRSDILKVKYRGKNVVEIFAFTVQQAFSFFRGQRKIQLALKSLIDAGLGYLRVGQSLSTLSDGEERRLKLAQHLGATAKGRNLFVVLKPTTGLHGSEISRLVDCFDSLLSVGHSLIVVDNNLQLAGHADWLIEMGPGPDKLGGKAIFCGTPEQMAESADSKIGSKILEFLLQE